MNIIERLQRLDALIVEHTKPPVTAILRNEIALCTEEAEAHAERGDRQDETLATQIKTIEQMGKEKAAVDAELLSVKAENAKLKSGPTAVAVPSGVKAARDRLRGL